MHIYIGRGPRGGRGRERERHRERELKVESKSDRGRDREKERVTEKVRGSERSFPYDLSCYENFFLLREAPLVAPTFVLIVTHIFFSSFPSLSLFLLYSFFLLFHLHTFFFSFL